MKGILKYIGLFLISLPLVMISCDSDDVPDTTANEVVLKGIKLLNAGVDGDVVVEGSIDENTKKVSFPRIDSLTNLSNLRFEAVLSENAKLETEVFDFSMEEGESELTKVMKVVNGPRFREYLLTVRLDVALFGAEFTEEDVKVYDHSGQSIKLTEFSGITGRQISMSSKNIFVADRNDPVLIDLEELRKGNVVRKKLDRTNATGWMLINGGAMVEGHIYTANMVSSLGGVGALKIYHWNEDAPNEAPTLVGNITMTLHKPMRYEGVLSLDLDVDGNGVMFVHTNSGAGEASTIRITVENFTTLSDPTYILFNTKDLSSWATINAISWAKDQYFYTGHQSDLRIVSSSGDISASVPASSLPQNDAAYAKGISFNGERYLAVISNGTGVLKIYDMSKGSSPSEALSRIDFTKNPLFTYSLGGAIPTDNQSISLDWYADGNEKLYIVAGAPGAGMVLIEFGKRTK